MVATNIFVSLPKFNFMKTATVKSVQANGTYNSQHGLLYKFEVTLSDGVIGEVSAKSNDPWWKQGSEVVYTANETQYGTRLKFDKPEHATQPTSNKDATITKLACLKASAEFNAGRTSTAMQVLQDAVLFEAWVLGMDIENLSKVAKLNEPPF